MHEFERAAELLEGVAANIESRLIHGPGGAISAERLEAMREHLKRFVDQEALYALWSAKEAKAARYLAGLLRSQAQAEEEPTVRTHMSLLSKT